MTSKIRIAIADDQTLMRQAISKALETEESFKVVGEAENGKVLLKLVKDTQPDVILLDLQMPVMDGWEALTRLKLLHPDCKVVIVSQYYDGTHIKELVQKGARGFLPKSTDFETLIDAIHDVHDLGYFFGRRISQSVVKELLVSNTINPTFREFKLSESEIDVLLLICDDMLLKNIAVKLNLSERTVERYRTSLFKKSGAKTSAGLVLFALKNNMISMYR